MSPQFTGNALERLRMKAHIGLTCEDDGVISPNDFGRTYQFRQFSKCIERPFQRGPMGIDESWIIHNGKLKEVSKTAIIHLLQKRNERGRIPGPKDNGLHPMWIQ